MLTETKCVHTHVCTAKFSFKIVISLVFTLVVFPHFLFIFLLQVNRTSELARVFGIDFFSVLSRGSQYRVESMFLRLAHTQNYLAISPGNQQVLTKFSHPLLLICG